MPSKGGAALPHRNIKKPHSSRKIRSHNFTARNKRHNIEAQILALELRMNALRRIANRANNTAKKLRNGRISNSAKRELERKKKENENIANMFTQMKF
jgi:hypothetical protein